MIGQWKLILLFVFTLLGACGESDGQSTSSVESQTNNKTASNTCKAGTNSPPAKTLIRIMLIGMQ